MSLRKKAKVNFVNNLFWLSPQISSYIRGQRFGYQPYKNLVSLVKQARLEHLDLLFSFNRLGEACYNFFNDLWRIKELAFRLNDENVKRIARSEVVIDTSLHARLRVQWDEASLKSVRNGNIPFYGYEWYELNFVPTDPHKGAIIAWRKKAFELLELFELQAPEAASKPEQE